MGDVAVQVAVFEGGAPVYGGGGEGEGGEGEDEGEAGGVGGGVGVVVVYAGGVDGEGEGEGEEVGCVYVHGWGRVIGVAFFGWVCEEVCRCPLWM